MNLLRNQETNWN